MKRSLQSLLSLQATPRGWRYTGLGTVLLLLILLQPIHSQSPVDVTITSDNAYVFGFGDGIAIPTGNLFGGVDNCTPEDIYNCLGGPETYPSIPATLDGYIYIVAWSDGAVWQGTIAEFTNGAMTILTQPGLSTPWEVFATGIDINPICPAGGSAPSLPDINYQIGLANASAGPPGSSVTWVNESSPGSNGRLEFHPHVNNSGGLDPGYFPPCEVCGIGPAQWMWYNPSPGVYDPFCMSSKCPGTGIPYFEMREYLIFRIGPLNQTFGETIPTLTEWGLIFFAVLLMGCMTWVVVRRRKRATVSI